MRKVIVHEHTNSYQAITTKSPHGFQCLKKLFLEYDHDTPNRNILEQLLARDFSDNENESARTIGREEAIQNIISSRQKCSRHQIDLKRAVCIEHDPKRHEVLFEGVRFMLFPFDQDREVELPIVEDKGDWIRVPFSGRLEIRVKENRFTMKDAVAEIIARRWTADNAQLVRRELLARRATDTSLLRQQQQSQQPISPVSDAEELGSPSASGSNTLIRNQSTGLSSQSQIGLPGGMSELPAALSALTVGDSKNALSRSDSRTLPPYPHSEVGTPTAVSGSSS